MQELLKTRRPTNPETEHFWRINMEKIELHRSAKERSLRHKRAEKSLIDSEMKCPKCGYELAETTIQTIACLKCVECNGVFFESSDVDSLTKGEKPQGLFTSIANVLN